MKMKIYIIGIGLIGGSFAMEMRKLFPKSKIIGIDKSENNLNTKGNRDFHGQNHVNGAEHWFL